MKNIEADNAYSTKSKAKPKLSTVLFVFLSIIISMLIAVYYHYPKIRAWYFSLDNKEILVWNNRTVEIYWSDYKSDSRPYKQDHSSSYAEVHVWSTNFTYESQRHSIEAPGVSLHGIEIVPFEEKSGVKIYWIRLGRKAISRSRLIYYDKNSELTWKEDP